MSCSYSEIKDVIQAMLSIFGLVTATSFDFLRQKFDQYSCCTNKQALCNSH